MFKKNVASGLLFFSLVLFHASLAFSLDTKDIIELKKAGLGSSVIETIMDEKAVETCAFTVTEIIDMKKAGMSDKAISTVIRKGSFTKDAQPVIYGTETKSIKSLTPEDLMALKKAGISDQVLNSIVLGSYDDNNPEHRRAWNMLENMGLIVDGALRR